MAWIAIDFETISQANIQRVGACRYAHDPTTRWACLAWVDSEGSRGVAYNTSLDPSLAGLRTAYPDLESYDEIWAFNIQFEYWILKACLGIELPSEKCCDIGWTARYYNLPHFLEGLADLMGGAPKDTEGAKLMLKMTKGEAWTKENWTRLGEYCLQDVEAERAIYHRLPKAPAMIERWARADLRMQLRGIPVDVESTAGLLRVLQKEETLVSQQFQLLTGCTPKASVAFKAWLADNGCFVPDVRKETLSALDVSKERPAVQKALELRKTGALASTSKLPRILDSEVKGRVHGALLFGGATTLRWLGRNFQPQNIPRGTDDLDHIEAVLELARLPTEQAYGAFLWEHGGVAPAAKRVLRGLIKGDAPLLVADYAQIEARIACWIAGQDDLLEAFKAYDKGEGPDTYSTVAAKLFNKPLADVVRNERQCGKALVLGGNYGIGPYKFQTTSKIMYALDLTLREAVTYVHWYRRQCESVTRFWADIEEAAKTTIRSGIPHTVGKITLQLDERFPRPPLAVVLPSGRAIYYPCPSVVTKSKALPIVYIDDSGEVIEEVKWKDVEVIQYWGINKKNPKAWSSFETYGGKLTEGICQAIGFDCLINGLCNAEERGFAPVLTVHDEMVAEAPGREDLEDAFREYCEALTTMPAWADGLPMAVAGAITTRYRKV